MNDNKSIQIKFRINTKTNFAFRRLLKIKKCTLQSFMEKLLIDYIYDNLNEIIEDVD